MRLIIFVTLFEHQLLGLTWWHLLWSILVVLDQHCWVHMIIISKIGSAQSRCNTLALEIHPQILGRITLHLAVCSVSSLWYRILKIVTLSHISILSKCSELLSIFQLWIMRFGPDQGQVVVARACGMFYRKLASSGTSTIDHLMILVIVTLCVYLVAQVLLIQVILLLTWYRVYHFRPSVDMGVSILFELHMWVLPRRHYSFLRVLRADVIILVSFGACNSVSSGTLVLILHVHHLRLALAIYRCVASSHEAQRSCASCVWATMIFSSTSSASCCVIERNMNSTVGISYK